jgi:phytanoyl-CoA hydroxylase
MLYAQFPTGRSVQLPETLTEDSSYFDLSEIDAALAYYETDGYVVIRGMLPKTACDKARDAFNAVRHSRIPILRQKNMRYERNLFDKDGLLSNPIFNVQDLHPARFGNFKNAALDILASKAVADTTGAILGGTTKLVQSMFFEAPAGTWAHQDSYYQDSSEKIGDCVAGWFALEDINARAGRFYVCPGSHRHMEVLRNEGELNFASGHKRYQKSIIEAVKAGNFELRAASSPIACSW